MGGDGDVTGALTVGRNRDLSRQSLGTQWGLTEKVVLEWGSRAVFPRKAEEGMSVET